MQDDSVRKDTFPVHHPLVQHILTTPLMEAQAQTSEEIRKDIRESLGIRPKPEEMTVLVHEGHCCEFPLWSFSKKRSTLKELHIDYDDGSFLTIEAPKGMPGLRFPGYLDVILFNGQRDLFLQDHTTLSVYSIFQTLGMDPNHSGNYAQFRRDMHRAFSVAFITDRFHDPKTGRRSYVNYFRILRSMKVAKNRGEESMFYFDDLFIASLRSGYLKRLNWDFALWLDKRCEALARFFYGHIMKRIGEKSLYPRNFMGFLRDCGLGYIAELEPKRRTEAVRETVLPALDLLRGEAIQSYEFDDRGNIFFIPKD